jgi:hypothetical protein
VQVAFKLRRLRGSQADRRREHHRNIHAARHDLDMELGVWCQALRLHCHAGILPG